MDESLLQKAIEAVAEAGKAIMNIYKTDFTVASKPDSSPITEADWQAHKIISDHLDETRMPVLSEEGKEIPFEERKNWEYFWLVDPLDGTKEFVSRNGEFTVNIALICNNTPVLGVVYAPALDIMYFAMQSLGSFRFDRCSRFIGDAPFDMILKNCRKMQIKKTPDKMIIAASRSHMNAETTEYIEKIKAAHKHTQIITAGSSLKFCTVAENKAHIYPRFGTTMEWDTAAGHAIVKYAGGQVIQANTEEELIYNKADLRNPSFIVR